jgi:type I restriction enzyme S subunit
MQQFRLLVPKRLEQERIISASTSAESALAQEHRTLGKLEVLKSGLVADLLTGRVRVPESLSAVEAQR